MRITDHELTSAAHPGYASDTIVPMRPDLRILAIVVVSLATLVGAVGLNATAYDPEAGLPQGNPAAATELPFSARLGVKPTAFYDPPAPLPAQPAGTILRSEPIDGAPEGVKAWRLLYLSRDGEGRPLAISALYLEPTAPPDLGNRFPLIGFAHGTTGIGRECGLSQAPFTDETPGNEYWRTLLEPMVSAGYAVVATDYEGMGAPGQYTYMVRKQGYDVLDSLRAALFFHPQVIDNLKLAVLGHSEGGYVAAVTADMAGSYAPELAIRGAVSQAPGIIPPLPFAVRALMASTGDTGPTPRSGYVADLSASWDAHFPNLSKMADWYTTEGMKAVPSAYELCQGAQIAALDQSFSTYYNSSLPNTITTIAATEQPLQSHTSIPILVQQGMNDTSVVPQLSLAMAIQGCALGDKVLYQQFPGDVHRSVQYTGRTEFLEWLNARFAGAPLTADYCKGW